MDLFGMNRELAGISQTVANEAHLTQVMPQAYHSRDFSISQVGLQPKMMREKASRIHEVHAAVLSSLVNDEYGEDILNHMLDMEASLLSSSLDAPLTMSVQNPSRCRLHRHSDRDPMVHASIPP